MYNMIKRYMDMLTKEQVNEFAIKNKVYLNDEELTFTYQFVKKNWEIILRNPNVLQLEKYKDKFQKENYLKIEKLIQMYYQKYHYFF